MKKDKNELDIEFYKQLINRANWGMILFNINGDCLKANSFFLDHFQVNDNNIIGKYNILKDMGFDAYTRSIIDSVFKEGKSVNKDILYNYKSSGLYEDASSESRLSRWFSCSFFPVPDHYGNSIIVVHLIDINDRKEIEHHLYKNTKELKILYDIILTANKTDKLDDLWKFISKTITENMDFDGAAVYFINQYKTKGELSFHLGLNELYLNNFKKIDLLTPPFNHFLTEQKNLYFDNFAIYYPEIASVADIKGLASIPLISDEGVIGFINFISNYRHKFSEAEKRFLELITQEISTVINKLKIQKEMKLSEEKYRSIIANSAIGIYHSSYEGKLIYLNSALAKILGYESPEDALSNLNDICYDTYVYPENRQKILYDIEHNPQGFHEYETELYRRDKSIFYAHIYTRAVRDGNNNLLYYEGFMEDVTEKKRAEEQIKAMNIELEKRVKERTLEFELANNELEAFAYSVSHDLRTPLRAIDGFSQALLEDYYDNIDETGQDFLKRIRKASQRMAALIDDLLKLSRITRSEVHKTSVNLSKMVNEHFDEYNALSEKQVEMSIEPNLIVKCDRNLMRIALYNLVENALKFSEKQDNPKIKFGMKKINDRSVYYVKDNGAGFDMKYYNKIFGVFQRLHSNDDYPGTGIGLVTSKRIIEKHGGEIWAEGLVGEGATFYFTLD